MKNFKHPLAGKTAALLLAALLSACSQDEPPQPAKRGSQDRGLALAEASLKYIDVATVGGSGSAQGGLLPARVAFRPQAVAAVGSPLAARIVSVAVRPGQAIKAGQPLITLQSAEMAAVRAAFEQASAKAAAAEDLLRRQTEMVARGVGLEAERFQAESVAKEARAELARSRWALSYINEGQDDRFTLRAPAAGVVLALRAPVGAMVGPGGEPLVEIGDPTRLWVVAEVPEDEIAGIRVGMQAEVRVPAADARFSARVDGIGQVVDAEQRRLPVYFNPVGNLPALTPGMQAEVRLQLAAQTTLSLPVSAVLIKDGTRRIVMLQRADGKFEARAVRTGVARDGRVAILEGLQAGDKVVVRGALLLDGEAEQLL